MRARLALACRLRGTKTCPIVRSKKARARDECLSSPLREAAPRCERKARKCGPFAFSPLTWKGPWLLSRTGFGVTSRPSCASPWHTLGGYETLKRPFMPSAACASHW